MCSNFDSCAILNSQAPKIFCLQNNVDFLGNSKVAFFFIHPVQGVPKKSDTIEIILLLLSTGFHAPVN